jgi:hypothetical protein
VKYFELSDTDKSFTFKAEWFKPNSFFNPSAQPAYQFPRQSLCNYVFVMPEDAADGSSFDIVFKGSDGDKNKNTQAYYATYLSGPGERQALGDILASYDGKWERVLPSNPQADQSIYI